MNPPTQWMRDGLCTGSPTPDLWFPEPGQWDVAEQAKAICTACPVQAECLAYASALGIRHGIWGGTAPKDRNGRKAPRRQEQPQMDRAARSRKNETERNRRRRLREAAAAGDPTASERLERERTRKRSPEDPAAARRQARKARAS